MSSDRMKMMEMEMSSDRMKMMTMVQFFSLFVCEKSQPRRGAPEEGALSLVVHMNIFSL